MFPAPAGMNRWTVMAGIEVVYVPRTCGDEPDSAKLNKHFTLCSPHLRG